MKIIFAASLLPFSIKLVLFANVIRCSASDSHLKLLDCVLNKIQSFLPDIMINLEKRRNITCLPILHKMLHKVYHPVHCKLLEFAKPTRITWHTAQQNDKIFDLARYNTYQFSRCFTHSTTCLWNSLPNEAVLAVKQKHFIILAKNFLCDQ